MTVASAAASAAIATKGVVRLDRGPSGTVATYGAGRRVPGVRVHDADGSEVHIHVVVTLDRPIPHVTHDVRNAVTAALEAIGDPGRLVHVHVTDIDTEPAAGAGAALPPVVTEELE
ncbi:MAG: Asp23/Gls24 family envelope stress response protein [Egibacteraceae bacterium]